ncbi:transcription initiation factor IIE subunit alpha [[Candida] railenensis]|uniref:Transcription initiation factor IIE subunit alpha n=1 Tax=[Candida] railenensis TaxID=45579 RepID=A0A9P0QNW1_9ASCO|nr:transcription initiation factor IIE subunit alpha [[Candida] railenensis]
MDDTVRSLIRFVARGFYTQPYILILDALLLHSVLSEEDLISLLGIHRKELRSYCFKLVEDRLLVSHMQQEENAQQRLTRRTYYYIHVTEAIDSIKWKVHSIVSIIKDEMSKYGNPQGYVCPRCGKKVSQLDAISLLSDDKTNFVCDNCGGILIEDDSSQQASIRQAKLEKLMAQVDPIITYLKKIDDSYIEDNTFESSLERAIPAQTTTQASYSSNPTRRSNVRYAQPSNSSKSQATLHVSITANDENYEREQQAKEDRRQKLEQNALPSWHSESTVGGVGLGRLDDDSMMQEDSTEGTLAVKLEDGEEAVNSATEVKLEGGEVKMEEDKNDSNNAEATNENDVKLESATDVASPEVAGPVKTDKEKEAQDALTAYYAQLAEKEAAEDDEDDEDDDEDDFDDFDDFEDV